MLGFVLRRGFATSFTAEATAAAARVNVTFRDTAILEESLTHPSFQAQDASVERTNAKLAQLGQSLIKSWATEHVFIRHPNLPANGLFLSVASLTGHKNLVRASNKIGIAKVMRWKPAGEHAENSPEKVISKTFAAFVGAVYVDQGADAARGLVHEHVIREEKVNLPQITDRAKITLDEMLVKNGMEKATYSLLRESGRGSHAPVFVAGAFSGGKLLAEGAASSIKRAEQMAAMQFLTHHYSKVSEDPLPELSQAPLSAKDVPE